jgi:diguanylate cyclase (GGDEF)-like protein
MDNEMRTIHVLLVEDDEDDYLIIRDLLMDLAGQQKYKLDWVSTYRAALKEIERGIHDIYLIDHYLEENSGLSLLKEAAQAGCRAPMIVVTGRSDREIDQAALEAGAMDYLVKGKIDGQLLDRSMRYALERNRLLEQIRDLALRDELTGLFNRRELHRFLEYEVIKCKRYGHPFSLMMMDIDHFKEINDRLGHRTGDIILQNIGQVLLSKTRGCDLAARYGGDEFIVVLPETTAQQAWNGAERLRKVVEKISIRVTNKRDEYEQIKNTISIGIAGYPEDADSGDALLDAADQALYQAKRQGCNCTMIFGALQEKEAKIK